MFGDGPVAYCPRIQEPNDSADAPFEASQNGRHRLLRYGRKCLSRLGLLLSLYSFVEDLCSAGDGGLA